MEVIIQLYENRSEDGKFWLDLLGKVVNSKENYRTIPWEKLKEKMPWREEVANYLFSPVPLYLVFFYDKGKNETEDGHCTDIFVGCFTNFNTEECLGKDVRTYELSFHLNETESPRVIDSIVKLSCVRFRDFSKDGLSVAPMSHLYDSVVERIYAVNIMGRAKKDAESKRKRKSKKESEHYRPHLIKDRGYPKGYDREAIVKTRSFRNLSGKTQVFGVNLEENYRTRMTHTQEVNQIAKRIAEELELDIDLTEAIALGHDIGHTPFGHQGEQTLDDILSGKIDVGIVGGTTLVVGGKSKGNQKKKVENRIYGGFKHNYQSVRLLTLIEENNASYEGLNIDYRVIDGVLKHTSLKRDIDITDFLPEYYLGKIEGWKGIQKVKQTVACATPEGKVVAIADEIAQRGHDIEDAIATGIIQVNEFKNMLNNEFCIALRDELKERVFGVNEFERLIDDSDRLEATCIVDVIYSYFSDAVVAYSKEKLQTDEDFRNNGSKKENCVDCSEGDWFLLKYLEEIVNAKVLGNQRVVTNDYNGEQVVKTLFQKYYENPLLLPDTVLQGIYHKMLLCEEGGVSKNVVNPRGCDLDIAQEEIYEWNQAPIPKPFDKNNGIYIKRKLLIRAITDYIAGMTDAEAIAEYRRIW